MDGKKQNQVTVYLDKILKECLAVVRNMKESITSKQALKESGQLNNRQVDTLSKIIKRYLNLQWNLTYPDTSVPMHTVQITEYPDK